MSLIRFGALEEVAGLIPVSVMHARILDACCVDCRYNEGYPTPHHKEQQMARLHHTEALAQTEVALTVLFCLASRRPPGRECEGDGSRTDGPSCVRAAGPQTAPRWAR